MNYFGMYLDRTEADIARMREQEDFDAEVHLPKYETLCDMQEILRNFYEYLSDSDFHEAAIRSYEEAEAEGVLNLDLLAVEVFPNNTQIWNPETEQLEDTKWITFEKAEATQHRKRTKGKKGLTFNIPVMGEEEYEAYEDDPDEIAQALHEHRTKMIAQMRKIFKEFQNN